MTTRTFKQQGQAYGSSPASIVATINGTVVYSGTVNTIDEPIPTFPNLDINPNAELFTWEQDVTSSDSSTLELTVTGAPLLLTQSLANYTGKANVDNPGTTISSGPTEFLSFYNTSIGNVVYSDPFSNVEIDGVPQERDNSMTGQWYWLIPVGSTFTAVINTLAGVDVPA